MCSILSILSRRWFSLYICKISLKDTIIMCTILLLAGYLQDCILARSASEWLGIYSFILSNFFLNYSHFINAYPFLSGKVWWDFNSSMRAAPLFFDRLSVQFVARHKRSRNEWERQKGGKGETVACVQAHTPWKLQTIFIVSSRPLS